MQKLEEPTLCIIEPELFRFSASGRNQLLLLLVLVLPCRGTSHIGKAVCIDRFMQSRQSCKKCRSCPRDIGDENFINAMSQC